MFFNYYYTESFLFYSFSILYLLPRPELRYITFLRITLPSLHSFNNSLFTNKSSICYIFPPLLLIMERLCFFWKTFTLYQSFASANSKIIFLALFFFSKFQHSFILLFACLSFPTCSFKFPIHMIFFSSFCRTSSIFYQKIFY